MRVRTLGTCHTMATFYNIGTTTLYNINTSPRTYTSSNQCAYAIRLAYPFGYFKHVLLGRFGSDPLIQIPLFRSTKITFSFLALIAYLWHMPIDPHIPHSELRETQTWRSYGRDGTDPPIDTLVKDLGDEHLLNIIKHLEDRYGASELRFLPSAWETMHNEVAWRLDRSWQQAY